MTRHPRDVVFTFSYETWDDAVRRGMMRPPDRLAQTLIGRSDVPRLMIANPFRWLGTLWIRRLLHRDRPFPVSPTRTLLMPWRLLRRRDATDLDAVARVYRAYGRVLARAARRRGLRRPAILTTNPLVAGFADLRWASSVTYFGRDDWLSYPGRQSSWPAYREAYRRIAESRIAVAAVSQPIIDRIGPRGRSVVVPNGVEAEEWTQETGPEPGWLASIPRAIYVGTLDERLDVEGLVELAVARPAVQIVLVGPVVDPGYVDPLRALANVHIGPAVGRAELVRVLRRADVCLVAHRRTPLTEAMSPLKAYEYLAAGAPVLSVDLPPMRGLGERVVLVHGVADFGAAIEGVIALGPAPEAERMAFVRANSWASRHERILDLMFADPIVSD
jgi:glycosyltransferase involved in cell wall biosynthesis